VKHDAFQRGYCTSGQICSAVAVLDEARRGWPSAVTEDLANLSSAASAAVLLRFGVSFDVTL
jgi:aerobic-type carbon monoxide dehydrogenase small subunit (CoxS/CutS family)